MAILKPAEGAELARKARHEPPFIHGLITLMATILVASMAVAGCTASLKPGELTKLRALNQVHQQHVDDQIHTYQPAFLMGPEGTGLLEKEP